MLDMLESMPDDIRKAYGSRHAVSISGKVSSIIICGMGGSGIGGELLKDYLKYDLKVPIKVNRGYKLPGFVNRQTLVFIVSYSGKTEETLSMLKDAKKKGANIVCVSSKKMNEKNFISVPSGLVPRMALPYLFFPILRVLEDIGMIKPQKKYVEESIKLLEKFNNSPAKKLAVDISGRTPIVYSHENFSSVALRWKDQFNENSKIIAHAATFTEIDHNEIESRIGKGFKVIIIRGGEDAKTKRQIKKSEKIIKKYVEVNSKGKSTLARMFYAIYFGDWTSYCLAKNKHIDPVKTSHINIIKKK